MTSYRRMEVSPTHGQFAYENFRGKCRPLIGAGAYEPPTPVHHLKHKEKHEKQHVAHHIAHQTGKAQSPR